jgi:diguanylate cyclase (GGDEF)-like protein
MESVNIDTLSSLLTHLSHLTDLSIALYSERGDIIVPPVKEDRLLSVIKSTAKGKAEFQEFIKTSIEKAIHSNNVSIFKCPAGQYHFFVPLRVDSSILLIKGGGIYLSLEDFEHFYRKQGPSYGLLPYKMKSWHSDIRIGSHSYIQDTARYIGAIFNLLLKSNRKDGLNEKRFRLMKIVISLLSDIKLDKPTEEFYDLILDIILFLFNADSASVLIKDNGTFSKRKSAGRLKDKILSMPVEPTGIISSVLERRFPIYSESTMDLLRLGFGDEVTSIYAFPILSENVAVGILSIFNCDIPQEEADIIMEICRITGVMFRLRELQSFHNKYMKELGVLNAATARITPLKESDMLYEAILQASIHLTNAEKGSLMLADEDTVFLTVKAAKGINKILWGEIKIKAGEGIAGWVFREGTPLMADDIEKIELGLFKRRPKYRTGSFISIPLKSGDKMLGVLNVSDKIMGDFFSEEDMVFLGYFASFATIALERSASYTLAGHLKELSITDSLTGLFNRRYFEERFFEEIQRSKRHNVSFSVAMIDIDDFKLFNDSEGHLAGDEVLKQVAKSAKERLRIIDVIARFGGEEFIVIMPQTEKDEAFLVAERIRRSVRESLRRTWHAFPKDCITVSIGIASFPHDGTTRKDLIRNADKALYTAKMEGKDRTVLWASQ